MKKFNHSIGATGALMQILIFSALLISVVPAWAEDGETSFDGLERVEDASVGIAYIHPDADFSVFKRVSILDPYVAFRANWQRDQRRNRVNVRDSQMERIKQDVADIFRDVFIETLEADDRFEVVTETGEDVLLLRPAIIDLDVTAPDIPTPTRRTNLTASAGRATLYIELYDSATGQILGRAADRQAVRRGGGGVQWTNRVSNRQDARRLMRGWAETLRDFLDQHYMKAEKAAE